MAAFPIENLPDIIHVNIFRYLTIQKRVAIERTSRRWQKNSKFVNSKERRLAINPKFTLYDPSFYELNCNNLAHSFPSTTIVKSTHVIDLYKLIGRLPELRTFYFDDPDFSYAHIDWNDFLRTLQEKCPNIEHISSNSIAIEFDEAINFNFPKVTCFHVNDFAFDDDDIKCHQFISRLPRLQFLKGIVPTSKVLTNLIRNGLRGISALLYGHMDGEQLRSIMKDKHKLEILDTDACCDFLILEFNNQDEDFDDDFENEEEQVSLRNLDHLRTFKGHGSGMAMEFLKYLPDLKRLSWTFGDDDHWTPSDVQKGLSHYGTQLESLAIDDNRGHNDHKALIELLPTVCPNLIEFSLTILDEEDVGLVRDDLTGLAHFEELQLVYISRFDGSEQDLREVLDSVSKLRSFEVGKFVGAHNSKSWFNRIKASYPHIYIH